MTDQYKGTGIMRHCWGCQRHRLARGGMVRNGTFYCAECRPVVLAREEARKQKEAA